jgi:cell wall-associated NlpC family hydrolase
VGRRTGAVLIILGLTFVHTEKAYAEKRNPQGARKSATSLRFGTESRHTRLDCSHFVNYVYRRAHLPYHYASSEELYEGIDSFRRVFDPKPGDLIVWKGHVGIVTNPKDSRFVSVLRSGVKTDYFLSPYWRSRGRPRFMRYVGNRTAERINRTFAQSAAASFASGE